MITGPTMIQRSDLIVISNNKLHLLELTAGYEMNTDLNCKRKEKTIEHSWTDKHNCTTARNLLTCLREL